jgi:glycosyltransferase involved in cell wall biosynthesis
MLMLARRYVRRFGKPDVLHAHAVAWGGEVANLISREFDVPFFITEHSTEMLSAAWRPIGRKAAVTALLAADGVVSVSRHLARAVNKVAPGLACGVIPNVVDTSFFASAAHVERATTPFRIISVGLLVAKKGMDQLIKAFAQAFPDESDVRLIIVGDGDQRSSLEALVRQLRLADRVEFTGLLSRAEIRQRMAHANVFALASRLETFGVVLIEALASGLPVVATQTGGPDDIVVDGVGWLVPPGDEGAFARALRDARENWQRFDRSSLAEYAEEHFGEQAVVDQLLNLYGGARV